MANIMLRLQARSDPATKPAWNIVFFVTSLGLIGALMLSVHNRYLPIQNGWFHYYALLTQKGQLPYRDFFYFLQPVPLFMFEAIEKLGPVFLYSTYYGMAERLILVAVLYYLLIKEFSPSSTFIAVVAAVFLYQSNSSDLMYSYYQTTLLLFLLILLCFKKAETASRSGMYFWSAGILASLVFFTKQSNGFIVSAFVIFLLLWDTQLKTGLKRLLMFGTGYSIPSALIIGWLVRNQLEAPYLDQVFGGASSKGPFIYMLFGFLNRRFAAQYLFIDICIAAILIVLVWRKWLRVYIVETTQMYNHWNIFVITGFVAVMSEGLLIPISRIASIAILILKIALFYQMFWVYLAFFILSLLSMMIGLRWITHKSQMFSPAISRLVLAGFAWMYAHGLSYQLEEHSALLGLAILLAIFFDKIRVNTNIPFFSVLTGAFLIVFIGTVQKNQIPYSWWGWVEFGHTESVSSSIPAFRGFLLSPESDQIYETVYNDILAHTTQNDKVFTYPFIPIFNYITNRLQPTFSPVHYFDVCPDSVAIRDAELLKQNPPKMIIFLDMPEDVYQFHENAFRDNKPSGQREMERAVKEIILKYNYKKIRSFLTPGYEWKLDVWVKP